MKIINNYIKMKNLLSYILEKLVINKHSKIKYQRLKSGCYGVDIPEDILIDSIKSIFISVYKNRTYKIKGLSGYTIKRSEINWEDVIEVLNTEYNHNLDPEYANGPYNDYKNVMRVFLPHIEKLVNGKTISFNYGDKRVELKGHDIYWKDWVNYRDKNNLKGY